LNGFFSEKLWRHIGRGMCVLPQTMVNMLADAASPNVKFKDGCNKGGEKNGTIS
ncbi:MAG: hypothetical protein H6Q71_1332, partial [Firmicutes bacterium]|nr:hypothetical protein [Bacillota bacterium]